MQVQFQHGDAEWQKWRARCLTDLYWFAGVVLGYGDKVRMNPRVHGLFCKFLDRKLGIPEIDQAPHRKVLMPRKAGKTVLGTQAYVIQRILQNPQIAILIANEKLETATTFLNAIKQQFAGNQLLRELFPELMPDIKNTVWTVDKIVINRTEGRREPTISCIGVGGTVTGTHPDLIVCDDMFSKEAMENARTGNTDLTGRINRWVSELRNLLNSFAEPFPEILFIGTRWYAGDPYDYVEDAYGYGEADRIWNITQKLPDGLTQTVAVRRRGDLAVFKRSAIEDGKTIWPENPDFTMEALAKARQDNPQLYACNMQNEPTDELTATFKESWLRYYTWIDDRSVVVTRVESGDAVLDLDNLDRIILVDPGGFKKAHTGDRMRGAVVVTGTDFKTNDHLILEAWSEQATFQQVVQEALAFCTRYKPRKVAIEEAGQQAAFIELFKRMARDANIEVLVEAVKPASTIKEQRIGRLESFFQRGQMYIGKGGKFAEFREQYRQFPRGRRVDLLDALAYGPAVWRKPPLRQFSAAQRQDAEKQAYYRKRGIVVQRTAL